MKPIVKSILALAVVSAPAVASAQGYYGPPPRDAGGFHHRMNRLAWGFSVGLGGMHDGGSGITNCDQSCDYNPAAFEADFHIGGFIAPRAALLFEAQVNGQTVHADAINGDTVLSQTAAMIALQYWLTPQVWIKGGIGFAHLDAQDSYNDYDFGGGGAIMGAVGFELMSTRRFALDLQGRIIEGEYHGVDDSITSATVGLGFNWY
jgi:hypothetical protein|nr:hypothetical protein [Kofleriaceae bacterium]